MDAFAFRCFPKTIDIPPDLQDRPLEDCKTSLRLADVLRKAGVRVLGDLHGRKVGDFASERNCGFETLHELDSLASGFAKAKTDQRCVSRNGEGSAKNAKIRKKVPSRRISFTIPESVSHLQFEELPITQRLANVARSIGLRTLSDLNGRSPSELLQYKDCGWRTVSEIQQLIERAISGEFDHSHIDAILAVELLTLLEQGIAKLALQEKAFLLARMEGLTFAEIGRYCGFTRARVHQVVIKALENLMKSYGPRIPRLLEMIRRHCFPILNSESFDSFAPAHSTCRFAHLCRSRPRGSVREQADSRLVPASLEQWMQTKTVEMGGLAKTKPAEGRSPPPRRRFRLSKEAQLRLIVALDKKYPLLARKVRKVGDQVFAPSGADFS